MSSRRQIFSKVSRSDKNILVATIFAFLTFNTAPVSAASVNSFYFEDFTADYYIEQTGSGSKMHVKEILTAVFPETNQNHGITRAIPFSNLNGKNITVANKEALNLSVLRNGEPESVSKIEKDEDEYVVYIGSSSTYVHGRQVYTLEYDFTNVISEFDSYGINLTGEQSDAVSYQELYWDTNGTGWSQKFENLTARVHLPAAVAKNLISGTSCYVGYYGTSGSNRCEIESSDETTFSSLAGLSNDVANENSGEAVLTFSAKNLSAGENLTFAINFEPDTFIVPELPKNYLLVITTIIVCAICDLILFFCFKNHLTKIKPKKVYYKGLFVAPQYAPSQDYNVAEAAELYFGRTENSLVASLLELAVSGKISIIKGEPSKVLKKETWKIKVNNLDNISKSQQNLLEILNGGSSVHVGDEIQIKKHTATSHLASLARSYKTNAVDKLKDLGLFEQKASSDSNSSTAKSVMVVIITIMIFQSISVIGVAFGALYEELFSTYGNVIGYDYLPLVIIAAIFATIIICVILGVQKGKYARYTNQGLAAANYLDGLYLYIDMAEKDRIKFLQSVQGADTSAEGIVKLYEKLLPYACIFGLEDSWMKELGKYCNEANYSLDWYEGSTSDLISLYSINSIVSSVNSSISASTSYSSSSSGSSSFSSGGGGGGFSGGGGGGGGGGGW